MNADIIYAMRVWQDEIGARTGDFRESRHECVSVSDFDIDVDEIPPVGESGRKIIEKVRDYYRLLVYAAYVGKNPARIPENFDEVKALVKRKPSAGDIERASGMSGMIERLIENDWQDWESEWAKCRFYCALKGLAREMDGKVDCRIGLGFELIVDESPDGENGLTVLLEYPLAECRTTAEDFPDAWRELSGKALDLDDPRKPAPKPAARCPRPE